MTYYKLLSTLFSRQYIAMNYLKKCVNNNISYIVRQTIIISCYFENFVLYVINKNCSFAKQR